MTQSIHAAGRERGAILATCLLLLLVLTVLGVAMMRMTNLQERMAGNTRDMNQALQGAEAALRDAETRLSPGVLVTYLFPLPALPCLYCDNFVLPVNLEDPSAFDWATYGQVAASDIQDIAELRDDPRFVIEETAFVPDDLLSSELKDGRVFYTVTARSTGGSGLANTVLQSTYARRF